MSRSLLCKVLIVSVLVLDLVNAQSNTNSTGTTTKKRHGILSYEPNKVFNGIFGALYLILGAIFVFHVYTHKDKWAICLPVGAICSGVGFLIRISLDPDNFEMTKFIMQQMFVVVSPSAFLAFMYLLYGRFIASIDPNFVMNNGSGSKRQKSKFSFIPPLIVGRIFIISDIVTFIIQCGAGGMQAAARQNQSLAKLGDTLFLIGVSAQGASYVLFTLLLTVAFIRLIKDRRMNHPDQSTKGWTGLDRPTLMIVGGLYFSSVFIIIRSMFRIIEFSQGYEGYLIGHEEFLFILDAAPLVLAIGVWAFIWPTVLLQRITNISRASMITPKSDWVPLN